MYPHVGLDDECDWNRVQPRYSIPFCYSSVADMPRANITTSLPHSTSENIKSNTNQDLHEMPELSIVHPPSQLCTHCQSSEWPLILTPKVSNFHENLSYGQFLLLQESADRGCTLCRFFWSYVVNSSSITKKTAGLLAEASLNSSVDSMGKDSLAMFFDVNDSNTPFHESNVVLFNRIENDSIGSSNDLKARQIKGII